MEIPEGFEKFDRVINKTPFVTGDHLTGKLRFSRLAQKIFGLEYCSSCSVYMNKAENQVGFRFVEGSTGDFKVSNTSTSGYVIACKSFLTRYRINADLIQQAPLVKKGDLLIINLKEQGCGKNS